MKNKRILISLAIVIACSTSVAFGYVVGSSNLVLGRYPEFTDDHRRPYKPYNRDAYSMENYSREVKSHVKAAEEYIDSANNDILRIKQSIDDTAQEANESIREHNNFIQTGY